ncbi:LysR family transcriptional regulator [Duganella rhizosphaerae]|uniref:LysR substrate-binding domain-containing protein n=1 Tax=Duganella rhizosphaerae TaxID=2885763 RepID=UPI0030E9FAFA
MGNDIDLALLRALLAIAEGGSFTAASRRLNLTQSAVSMQIKRLEEIAGGVLFERNSRNVSLNRRGELMQSHARRMLSLNDEMLAHMRDDCYTGLVRIGAIEDYAAQAMPAILAAFMAAHPTIAVEVETGFTPALLERLGDDFDMVLAMHPAGAARGEVIRRERAVWLGSRRHACHEQAVLPLALHPPGCQFRAAALTALDQARRRWRLAYLSQSMGAIDGAVAAGLAITVGKAGLQAHGLDRLTEADGLPPLPTFEIALHRAPRRQSAGATALAELLLATEAAA